MAISSVSYPGNGSTQTFSLTFNYLSQSHVSVTVDGVAAPFTWATPNSVTLATPPANGTVVTIKRTTPTTPEVDFVDGSNLTEAMLDLATRQALYVSEETQDQAVFAINLDTLTNTYNGQNRRFVNVADPIDDQDVATKHWSETAGSSFVAQAAAQATTAAASASAAATSASNAATSASNASGSATAAANSATTATTKAGEASASATAAAGSATTATTKASEAATSASNAATSASQAATSASNAGISEANASASAISAAASLDAFDDRYLGQKASDPSVDNEGNPLITGALYFNTTSSQMLVYTGSNWQAVAPVVSVSNDSITFAHLQNIATATLIGRNTAGTGDPESIPQATQAEMEAGTVSALRGMSPLGVKQAITALASTQGALIDFRVFTASGTYTKATNNPSFVIVEVVGGGGGGGGASNAASTAGAGGGGGGYSRKKILASALAATETVTVGAAGTSGTTAGGNGGTGGTSSFGALVSATGGSGGAGSTVPTHVVGGAGGTGSGGDLNLSGGTGAYGGSSSAGGGGMAPLFGVPGSSVIATATGIVTGLAAKANTGGGGGGGKGATTGGAAGGAGGSGLVIVWEYK